LEHALIVALYTMVLVSTPCLAHGVEDLHALLPLAALAASRGEHGERPRVPPDGRLLVTQRVANHRRHASGGGVQDGLRHLVHATPGGLAPGRLVRLLHAFRWLLHRGGRLGHRPDSGRVWAPGGRFEEKDVCGSNENVRVPSCSNFDTISFASVFQPERREVSLPTPRLRTPRTMLRAVLGRRPRARRGGRGPAAGWRTHARPHESDRAGPVRLRVRGLRRVRPRGLDSRPRGTRVNFITPRPPVNDAPRGSRLRAGTPGNARPTPPPVF
jgi:hypothetical protein